MTGYFSFQKFISTSIVKLIYALGFIALTAGGIALIVWAGLRLNNSIIDRQLGWRYVAVGAGAVVIGNIAWRVICEFWMVLFSINERLAELNVARQFEKVPAVQFVERRVAKRDRRVSVPKPEDHPEDSDSTLERFGSQRPASVLGLS